MTQLETKTSQQITDAEIGTLVQDCLRTVGRLRKIETLLENMIDVDPIADGQSVDTAAISKLAAAMVATVDKIQTERHKLEKRIDSEREDTVGYNVLDLDEARTEILARLARGRRNA